MIVLIVLGCLDKRLTETEKIANQVDPYLCFSETPETPIIIHAVPYTVDAVQSPKWRAIFGDGSSVDFEMGRATMGHVNLSSDGTWGAVAQENGSIGIFQVEPNSVDVIDEQWIPVYENETLYATRAWLDPLQDRLWFVDGNLSLKGGLYSAPIDCESKTLGAVEKFFMSKHGGPIAFVNEVEFNTIFVGESIESGPQVTTFNRYNNDSPHMVFDAFPDNEAIFSSMGSNGRDVLIGDNNAFSGLGNRVVHIDVRTGETIHSLSIEDPTAIEVQTNWALIASGFQNALYLYDLTTLELGELTLSYSSQLPFSIVPHNGNVYIGQYNGIREISMDSTGYLEDHMLISGTGIDGIFGPFGIVGDW